MNKKSKLLKSWTQTTTYFTVIAALVSFTEPLSAGRVIDGDDNNVPPRRVVQVVFGTTVGVDPHPTPATQSVQAALGNEDTVRTYMRDILPPIDKTTHIQFWHSQDEDTRITHTLRALSGAAGAQENAYRHAIATIPHATPIVPAIVTFSLHQKLNQ